MAEGGQNVAETCSIRPITECNEAVFLMKICDLQSVNFSTTGWIASK